MAPIVRLTMVTLGVTDVARSAGFYEALGFGRRMKSTGDKVIFFKTGASVLSLYAWGKLAADAQLAN
jgi:predicted lactoylglutathione lyase